MRKGNRVHRVITLLAIVVTSTAWAVDDVFEAPVRLAAGTELISAKEKLLYPSPVMMDVDGDRQLELVVGDLWGFIRVYENQSTSGDPVWVGPTKLQAEGEDLKVPNW